MFNIVIFEANQNQANLLKALIEKSSHNEAFNVVVCPSAAELAQFLSGSNVISVLFVDVWMGNPQKRSGITTLPKGVKLVKKYHQFFSRTQIVYVGELEYYTSAIYETEHTFFLSKPFLQHDVDTALGCALTNLANNNNKSLPVKIGTSIRLIKYADIVYIESQRRKLRIHLANEVVDMYGSLAAMAAALPMQFVQCHKSFIVNLDYAVELDKEGFVMASGDKIAVSQTKRKDARRSFMNHLALVL